MNKKIILLLLVFLAVTLYSNNPLFNNNTITKKEYATKDTLKKADNSHNPLSKFKLSILRLQKDLYQKLFKLKSQLNSTKGFLMFLLIAFAYGFIHALGPGHGKFFLTGYFLCNKKSVKQSIAGGLIIGLLHAVSGIFLVFILYYFLKMPINSTSDSFRNSLEIISFSLLLFLGVYSLIKILSKKSESSDENTTFWGLVLSVGLIPCPGAVMLSLFGISILENLTKTVLLVIFMGTGMSLAISIFSLIPTLLHKIQIPLTQNPVFLKSVKLLGASILSIAAALLLLSKLV